MSAIGFVAAAFFGGALVSALAAHALGYRKGEASGFVAFVALMLAIAAAHGVVMMAAAR